MLVVRPVISTRKRKRNKDLFLSSVKYYKL